MPLYDFCLPINLVVLELKVGQDMCVFISILCLLLWGFTLKGTRGVFEPATIVFVPYSSEDTLTT
jgi:hypothetical protein